MPTLEQLLTEAYSGSPNLYGRSGLSRGRNYSEPIPMATEDLPRANYLEELFNPASLASRLALATQADPTLASYMIDSSI